MLVVGHLRLRLRAVDRESDLAEEAVDPVPVLVLGAGGAAGDQQLGGRRRDDPGVGHPRGPKT
jgi:hypothetical protein